MGVRIRALVRAYLGLWTRRREQMRAARECDRLFDMLTARGVPSEDVELLRVLAAHHRTRHLRGE